MTETVAISKINGYSDNQIAYHNKHNDTKIHSIKVGSSITQAEIDEVEDVESNYIATLDSSGIDSLNANLPKKKQLSQRPC